MVNLTDPKGVIYSHVTQETWVRVGITPYSSVT